MKRLNNYYHRIKKFWYLPYADKKIFIKAFIILAFFRIILKFVPVNTLHIIIKPFFKKPLYSYTSFLSYTYKVIWAVEKAGSFVLRKKCLPQALAVQIMLNKKRINNDLEIGFIKQKGGFTAHAWVTAEDIVLMGDNNKLDFYFKIPLQKFSY